MLIEMKSQASGLMHTFDIPITMEQLNALQDPSDLRLIQDICPGLEPWQREFLMTGITAEEWADIFAENDEESEEDEDDAGDHATD